MNGHAISIFETEHRSSLGHFPGNPIIPGAVLLQQVVARIGVEHPGLICRAVISAKFLRPVRPGDTIAIDWKASATGDIRFTCQVAHNTPAVTGVLRVGPP